MPFLSWTTFRTKKDLGENATWLMWLVRLRWVAIFAQLVTLGFAVNVLHGTLSIGIWIGLIVVMVLANLYAIRSLKGPISEWMIWSHLAADVLTLTTFFVIGGGTENPFISLYLVHVAMAAVMLSQRFAVGLMLLVLSCYFVISAVFLPLRYEGHSLPLHVLVPLGRTLSFTITTVSITVFIVGIARALRIRREQLLQARDRTHRIDRLRSLGTLAAGAAHELNTPLSTLGLRLRRIGRRHQDDETIKDLAVMKSQLERCTSIVGRLLVGAGDPMASDIARRPLFEMCKNTVALWSKGTILEIKLVDEAKGLTVELPQVAFQQALTNLLENARQAQESVDCFDSLLLRVYADGADGVVDLVDHGCGLPPDPEQIGEPFFTTKPTGTGLGVFVARALSDGAGGGLTYIAQKNGTLTRWWFPGQPKTDLDPKAQGPTK